MSLEIEKVKKTKSVHLVTVLGLDCSTNTGYAALTINLRTGELTHKVGMLKFPPMPAFQRHSKVYDVMSKIIKLHKPNLVIVEGYAPGGSYNNNVSTEIGGITRAAVHDHCGYGAQVAPTSLKKYVTGVGKGKKNVIMLGAYKNWGIEGTDDEIDAYALAHFGISLLGIDTGMGAKNMEAITAWKKNNAGDYKIPLI